MALPAGVRRANASHILLDNQSSVHIFHNKNLLSKPLSRSPVPLHLGGIVEGQVLKTDRQGSFLDIANGNVWFSTRSVANILSLHQLHEDGFPTLYDKEQDCFALSTPNDGVLVFRWDNDIEHYVCNFDTHVRETSKTNTGYAYPTVAQNAAKYPARQLKAAKTARELLHRAGFPSTGKLKELISSGNVINEGTSVQDLERADDIFGPSVASMKGKTSKIQPTTMPLERPRSVVRGALTMHVDVVFMRAVPYLFAVTTPLGYLSIEVLTEKATPVASDDMERFVRSTSALQKALFKMFNEYRAHQFAIEQLLTDNEGGIQRLTSDIQALGCVINPNGPGQHVALVEHKAKILKERRRCHIHHVPFALPLILELYLIRHCVYTMNMMPTKTRGDHIAPAVDFFGRKLDSGRDLRFVWGDLCQAYNPNNTITNSDTARTDTCVLLLSTGNLNGSVKMMNLSTWKVVTRDQWKVIPYDHATVMQISQRAMADEVSLTSKQRLAHRAKDAVFRRVHTEIIGTAEDDQAVVVADENPIILHDLAPTDEDDASLVADRSAADERGESPTPEDVVDPRGDTIAVDAIQGTIGDTPLPTEAPVVIETVQPEPDEPVSSAGVENDPSPHTAVSEDILVPELSSATDTGDDAAPTESRYNLRNAKRYPTSTVFTTYHSYALKCNTLCAHKSDIIHHMTAAKALKRLREPAVKAIVKELLSLCDKNAWTPVDTSTLTRQQCRKIIRSSMFIKEKYLADGSFEKLKARLVAGGHMQKREDFGDVSSPVVNATSVHIIAVIAARERRHVYTVDVGSAFLNSDMSGDNVLMSLDPLLADILCKLDGLYSKFRNKDGTLVVHLTKALYGCIRSSLLWYETLSAFLIECGFVRNAYDPCVLNRSSLDSPQCTVCFHVDDLFITCVDDKVALQLVKQLKGRFGEVSVHSGTTHNYLGAVFDFCESEKVRISMPHHTQQLIDDSGIEGKSNSPAATDLFDIDTDSPLLKEEEKHWFHSFVHRVMYLANRINGECLVACSFLSSRTQFPTVQDMEKLKRLLRYLNANPTLVLTLYMTSVTPAVVLQYTDASYGVHSDGKSHSGSCISLGFGAIHARSVKQKINTKSSTESELVALSDEASRGLWCKHFLEEQEIRVPQVTQFQDNMSAMMLATKGMATAHRSRHIKVRYFWVSDYIRRQEMKLVHLESWSMIADGLTKPLIGADFIRMRRLLLNM